MKRIIATLALITAGWLTAAPAPYPLTVNSRAQSAPPVLVYRANEHVFRVSFVDGTTPSNITNMVPFMAWSTNSTASGNSTSSYSVVGLSSTGVVDFTFSPSSVNHAAGRYIYEVGLYDGSDVPHVYRQGTFTIQGSPVGQGVDPVTWTDAIDWSLYEFSNTSASGPVRPDFTTISAVTNADGSITISAMVAGVAWGAITGTLSDQTDLQSALDAKLSTNNATYTQTVALAASALQSEADTLATVTARGATTTAAVTLGGLTAGSVGVGTNTVTGLKTVLGYRVQGGQDASATGSSGIALGREAVASGNYASAFGSQATASGDYSYASGRRTFALGTGSIAMGHYSTVSNSHALVWSGVGTSTVYYDNGVGTANFYPQGGWSGFYISGTSLNSIVSSAIATATGGCVQVSGSFAGAMDQGVATTDSPTFAGVLAPSLQATTTAGWSINANNGSACMSGGAGGGYNVSFANGVAFAGTIVLTNDAPMTLKGTNVALWTFGSIGGTNSVYFMAGTNEYHLRYE